ncbi:hypothetical protein V8J38_16840 (plasmid) [Brevundimonas olei]|uniref:Uncharacterized protein n=1 Tax=Brevundimonas olei TaxID=657642 RepID=A0ABZ2IGU0_9CAUL
MSQTPSRIVSEEGGAVSDAIRAKYDQVKGTTYRAGTPAERMKDGRLQGLNDALAIAMVSEERAAPVREKGEAVTRRTFKDRRSQNAYDLFVRNGWMRGDLERFYRSGFAGVARPDETNTPRIAVWLAGRDRAEAGLSHGIPDRPEFRNLIAALASCEEAPAKLGERDYPAEFEAWWATYRHRNRDVADYTAKKQIAFDAFYFGAHPPPQAREDTAVVAWVPIHPRNGPLWAEAGPDARDKENLKSYPFRALCFASPLCFAEKGQTGEV